MNLPRRAWSVGQALDWDAAWEDVVLFVELPFWLMVPNGTVTATVAEHDSQVDIADDFWELYVNAVSASRETSI